MDGYIIVSDGGVNFESKEVSGSALKSTIMLGTKVDKVIHIQSNIDGWQSLIKVATREAQGIGTGLETHGHKGGGSFFIPMAGATLEAIQGLD
eukprot:12459243-Ditylum_brightwellii.AAC.2